jgi:dTMP kinase
VNDNGVFISFEGPEGCGKSTQIARLTAQLDARGYEVVHVREPGGTATGEIVRGILQHDVADEPIAPRAETLLFVASRAQLVTQVIRPALARGAVVLCDRFSDSTLAYQGYGRGMPLVALEQLHDFALDGCMPQLTLLLEVSLEVGFARLAGRQSADGSGPDRMERESRDFHARVHRGYDELATRHPERIQRVDGTASLDAVAAAVWSLVVPLLASATVAEEST